MSTNRKHTWQAAMEVKAFLSRNKWCAACMRAGVRVRAEEVDHIISIAKGGLDIDTNKQGLCKWHHHLKTADDMGWIRRGGCDTMGLPLDPMHPWHRSR